MRVLILGGDGYLGWATAMALSAHGFRVGVVDNYLRRTICHEIDAEPLIEVPNLHQRVEIWRAASGHEVEVFVGDVADYAFLQRTMRAFQPEGVVHYAEQPSAPYSMMDHPRGLLTLQNNLTATFNVVSALREAGPGCHLVKLGTMGEYGTPNIDIEEGYLEITHNGRSDTFLFPKRPGSIYHLTKVQDSDLLYFAAHTWGLAITDLNQGPVYGIETAELAADQRLAPIFNYDAVMGTVLNRFVVQAVAGAPLTVYGKGGQTRGFLNIRDTVQCIELALRQPAKSGEFRVFNQFTEQFTVNQLAEQVARVGNALGLGVRVESIPNPRKELEEHYYNAKHTGLIELGLQPHLLTDEVIAGMIEYVQRHRQGIRESYIYPRVKWA